MADRIEVRWPIPLGGRPNKISESKINVELVLTIDVLTNDDFSRFFIVTFALFGLSG
jgi:hypothetical protein